MSDTGPIKELDTIQGSSYLAIQAAIEVVRHHNPNLAQCHIRVVRDEKSEVVIFTGKNLRAGIGGSLAVRPESREQLNAHDLSVLMSNTDHVKILDTVQGSSFLAIQAAVAVFQRYKPDLSQYKMAVVRDGNSLVVIFSDKGQQAGGLGSLGARPGFEVELDSQDLRVLRSHFTR